MPKRPLAGALLWVALGVLAAVVAFITYHQLWPHQQLVDDHNLTTDR